MAPEELIRACLAGDAAAWRRFVADYGPWIRHVARRSGGDPDEVESELFAELVRDDRVVLRSFRAPFNLKAWLAVLSRRTAARLRRRAGPAAGALEDAIAAPEADGSSPGLGPLLAELPPMDRLILTLCCVDELSYEEVAKITGIGVNTLGKRKTRAMLALREIAKRRGFEFLP